MKNEAFIYTKIMEKRTFDTSARLFISFVASFSERNVRVAFYLELHNHAHLRNHLSAVSCFSR